MSDMAAAAVLAPIAAGAVFCFMALLWKIQRPWEVIYKIMFSLFGVFLLASSVGMSNSLLTDYPLNAGSSPSMTCPTSSTCFIAYFNSTGDLMVANDTVGSPAWTSVVASQQDGIPSGAANLAELNVVNVTWFVWIFVAAYVILMILEIGLWYVDMLKTKRNKRSGRGMSGGSVG